MVPKLHICNVLTPQQLEGIPASGGLVQWRFCWFQVEGQLKRLQGLLSGSQSGQSRQNTSALAKNSAEVKVKASSECLGNNSILPAANGFKPAKKVGKARKCAVSRSKS